MKSKAFASVVRYLLVFAVVCLAVMVSTWVVPVRAELLSRIAGLGPAFMALAMVNFALTALVLFLFLRRAASGGWRLAAGLTALFWGVLYAMSQMESLIFNEALTSMGTRDILDTLLRGLVSTALAVPAATLLTGGFRRKAGAPAGLPAAGGGSPRPAAVDSAPRAAGGLGWKLPLAGLVFLAVYWLFGYFVAWQFPAVRRYYSGSAELVPFFPHTAATVTGSPWFLPMQFGRGLLWGLLALLALRLLDGSRTWSILAVAAVFALFGLQLLVPNPLMPDVVRLPHLLETSSSMLLYGAFLGWLLGPVPGPSRSSIHSSQYSA